MKSNSSSSAIYHFLVLSIHLFYHLDDKGRTWLGGGGGGSNNICYFYFIHLYFERLFVCLFVCVKTAEPIVPKICVEFWWDCEYT